MGAQEDHQPVRQAPDLKQLSPDLRKKIEFDPGTSQIVVLENVDAGQLASLRSCLAEHDRKELEMALMKVQPREPFRIPLLGLRNKHGQLDLFEKESLLQVPWNPAAEDAALASCAGFLSEDAG